MELFTSTSTALDKMTNAAEKLRQRRATISSQKKMSVVADWQTSIKDFKEIMPLYKAREYFLKRNLKGQQRRVRRSGHCLIIELLGSTNCKNIWLQKVTKLSRLSKIRVCSSDLYLDISLIISSWVSIPPWVIHFHLASLTHSSMQVLPLLISLFIVWKVLLLKNVGTFNKGKDVVDPDNDTAFIEL